MLKLPQSHVFTVVRVALGVALLWWLLVNTGAKEALKPLFGAHVVLLILLIGLFLGSITEAVRLRVLFRAAGLRLNLAGAYRVVLIGLFFNFCIPGGTGGDLVKLYYLAGGNRAKGVEVATVIAMDRVLALGALLVLLLILAVWNADVILSQPVLVSLVTTAVLGLVLLFALLATIGSRRIRSAAATHSDLMRRLPLHGYFARAADAAHQFRDRKTALLTAATISFAGHVGAAFMFVAIGWAVVPSVSSEMTALLSLMGMVANAIPVTPGGLGVGEAAFDQLFGLVGATGAAAVLIGWRMALIPLAVVGAFLYMAGSGRRLVDQRSDESDPMPGHALTARAVAPSKGQPMIETVRVQVDQ